MQKRVLILFLFIIIFCPKIVLAAKVSAVTISGNDKIITGNTEKINIDINVSDISSTDNKSFGIAGVVLDLEYDKNIFTIIDANSKGFTTTFDSDTDTISSIITGKDVVEGTCQDDILYCSNFHLELTIYIKDTDKTSSKITVNNITLYGFDQNEDLSETYKDENMKALYSEVSNNIAFTISKGSAPENPPKVEISKTSVRTEKAITEVLKAIELKPSKSNQEKSDNNYLSDITIKGYPIEFYKRTREYEIVVTNDTTNLEIEAVLEDKTATLEITGADNLQENNDKVEIKVTAEDGSIRIYSIKVSYEQKNEPTKLTSTIIMDKIKKFYRDNKLYIFIGAGVLFIIILVSIIVGKINDRKLGNKFDNF